jgi:hypothetical protein
MIEMTNAGYPPWYSEGGTVAKITCVHSSLLDALQNARSTDQTLPVDRHSYLPGYGDIVQEVVNASQLLGLTVTQRHSPTWNNGILELLHPAVWCTQHSVLSSDNALDHSHQDADLTILDEVDIAGTLALVQRSDLRVEQEYLEVLVGFTINEGYADLLLLLPCLEGKHSWRTLVVHTCKMAQFAFAFGAKDLCESQQVF